MNVTQRDPDRICRLLWAMRDGALSPDDAEQLRSALLDDPQARETYVYYMFLSGSLEWDASAGGDKERIADLPLTTSSLPSLSTTHHPLPATFVGGPVFSYLVASVVLCLMLLGAWAYKISHVTDSHFVDNSRRSTTSGPHELVFVGKITGMKDCRWSNPDTGTIIGAAVALDREYALSSGLMEITYTSGAKVILEGPCTYKVDSSAGGYLAKGKLTARVETKGSGFRVQGSEHSPLSTLHSPLFAVRTPTAIVTDLGTEFGVEVAANGDTTSYVFQGSISVQGLSASADSSIVLHETESIRVSRVRETHHDSTATSGTGSASGTLVRFTRPATPPKFVREITHLATKYVYDFSRCEPGNIDGQDGWHAGDNGYYTKTNFIEIKSDAAFPMSGKYAVWNGDDYKGNIHVRRANDADWSFSIPADKDWEISALVLVDSPQEGTTSYFGLNEHARGIDAPSAFGVGSRGAQGYNLQWRVAGVGHSARIGDQYRGVCKVGMTADALGENRYRVMLWYETTPGDVKTRRYFTTIPNVEADVTACNSILTLMQCRTGEAAPTLDDLTIRVD